MPKNSQEPQQEQLPIKNYGSVSKSMLLIF